MTLKPLQRHKLIVFGVVAGAGLLVAIAIWRFRPGDPSAIPPEQMPKAMEYRASELEFDLRPDRLGASGVARAVGDRVAQAAASMPDVPAPEQLAERVAEHLELMIEPDFDRWITLARRYAPETGRLPDGSDDPEFRRRWQSNSKILQGSPVASSGISVRRIDDPLAFPEDRLEPGVFILSSAGATSGGVEQYPIPQGRSLTGVEVLVPLKFKTAEGIELSATAGLRFARTETSNDWQPVGRAYFYLGPEAFDRKMRQPPF